MRLSVLRNENHVLFDNGLSNPCRQNRSFHNNRTMTKKRRTTSSRGRGEPAPAETNAKDAKLAAISSWEDVADDGQDAFDLQRDSVSVFDHGRRQHEDDEDRQEEEVMGLGMYGYRPSDDDDEEEEEGESDEGSDEGDDEDNGEAEMRRGPGAAREMSSPFSDEQEEELAEEGWGSSKKAYYGGHGGEPDGEDEVDHQAEEEEARRIQHKQMAGMAAADFAFDEDDWAAPPPSAAAVTAAAAGAVVTEHLPSKLPDAPEERTRLLHTRHPEFQPLAHEFLALQEVFPALEMGALAAETAGEAASPVVRKWRIASAYLGVLSMYFALLTEDAADGVRDHPIMAALLGVRAAWETVKDQRVERIEARLDPVLEEAPEAGAEAEKRTRRKRKLAQQQQSDDDGEPPLPSSSSPEEEEEEDGGVAVQAARKAGREDFSDLDALAASPAAQRPAKKTKTVPDDGDDGADFGEDAVLNDLDAEDKRQRRKNLRFYTAQITAKASKRDAASRGAGGDADVPHRERRKERELRLQAEAQRRRDRGQGADLGADLSDSEPDAGSDAKQRTAAKAPSAADGADPDNEYYALLASAAKSRKADRKQLYEAQKAARKEGSVLLQADGGPVGKREIGWKIMKNKGLTPKRKKEVRNPRVKKKMQYEKKMKKVGSTRAVYRGGLHGAYGGEATGIKRNVVKSVKFA